MFVNTRRVVLTPLALRAALYAVVGTVACLASATDVYAVGPTVSFTLPAENSMPAPFGSIPFPSDLYFDQGEKGDGDGTLLNAGTNVGISVVAINPNFSPAFERGLDVLDGWGVSTGCHVFFSGAIDVGSLPTSPVTAPTVADSVFLMNLSDGSVVPVRVAFDVDTRVANALTLVPLPGTVLDANTTYACVVTTSVLGGGMAVVASGDFVDARDKVSANSDANDIYGDAADVVVANGGGLLRTEIAGMAVFTTLDPTAALVAIQTIVLPGLPLPTADFGFTASDLVFDTPAELDAALGTQIPHSNIDILATGYYDSPRFQTHDPFGNSKTEDLPNLANLAAPCLLTCEPDDERFVDVAPADGLPDIQSTPKVPFTVVIPNSPAPAGGYPIIIDQHGLGQDREIVALLGDSLAEAGFASIGIDAVGHGYRFHDPNGADPVNANAGDAVNNFFGGTTVPDGFADQGFFGLPLAAVTTQLGFFQAFTNLVGVRDNFRQTAADLMQLVRLIQSNTIDSALGVSIDENNIYYLGHSLGAIMGSVLAAHEPDIKAYVLNAPGGGLFSQLFVNSSIGAGALASVNTIFGLDPANVADDASIIVNVTQALLDGGDPISQAPHWVDDPLVGGARNIGLVIDHQDEVVPNQANEALLHASGLELYRPFVANPMISPVAFPTTATSGTISANGPGGVTAFAMQQGPASHAATVFPEFISALAVSNLNFVPGFALTDEWGPTGTTAYPSLERTIRIKNESSLVAVLAWLNDIVSGGPPGTFSFSPAQNPNPRENESLTGGFGSQTVTFFDRAVDGVPLADTTPDVEVSFNFNFAPGRLTSARSTLGTTGVANNEDMPPDVSILSSGFLPFFATLQKEPVGTFDADVTISYTTAELEAAGIADGSPEEANLLMVRMGGPGTCALGGGPCTDSDDCIDVGDPCIEVLASSSVDTGANTITATGLTTFSTFGVVDLISFAPALRIPGGGSTKTDCVAEWLLSNPGAAGVLDGKGLPATKQSCTQGDPSCDVDTDPTQCTYRVGLCFLVPDSRLPECSLSGLSVDTYEVSKPSAKDAANPKKPKADVARAALLAAVDDVLTLPQSNSDNCTTFDIEVPLKNGTKRGKQLLKIRSSGPNSSTGKTVKDGDKLLLNCEP